MNLLLDSVPEFIVEYEGKLYFNTDIFLVAEEDDYTCYGIATDYGSIINIFLMYETAKLTEQEKAIFMLSLFYTAKIPYDIEAAYKKAIEFMDLDKYKASAESQGHIKDYSRLYSWEQDGDHIFSSINYSHNDILVREPDLHWYLFVSKFMQLKEDCRFSEIINNRAAHKAGKATKEQRAARREHPEIYLLKADRAIESRATTEMKEMERMLNNN